MKKPYENAYDILQKENCTSEFLYFAIKNYIDDLESQTPEKLDYNVIIESLHRIVQRNRDYISMSSEFVWSNTNNPEFWQSLYDTAIFTKTTNAIDFYFNQLSSLDYLKLIIPADTFLKTLQDLINIVKTSNVDKIRILIRPFKITTADGEEYTVRNFTTMDELLKHYQETLQQI